MNEDQLANIIIRHTVASEQYGKGLADRIVRLLNDGDRDLVDKIAARYALAKARGFDRGPATTRRLEQTLQAIRAVNAAVYQRLAKGLEADLTKLASHEAEFAASAGAKAKATANKDAVMPDANFLQTLVTQTPLDGVLLAGWITNLSTARMTRLEQAIRTGLLQGETTDSLVQRIVGTRDASYTDGILNVSRKSARTLALTANSTIANHARLEAFRNMESIGFVEWSSILDSRTTPICQSLSGRIYSIDEPHPVPPVHPRCRSILIPRRNDTDPPKHKPFSEWLEGQSDRVQSEILGRDRARVFRKKPDMDFAEFFRKDGTYKTLDELIAFDKGILDDLT